MAADPAPSPSTPEFGGQCAEALSEGQHVTTDCSITWTDKDGKTYCFSSADAKKSFLTNPAEKLERAHEFMAAGNVEATETAMQNYTASDAEALVKQAIDAKLKANGGTFPMDDALDGDHLKLAFDGIDFTRTIDGYGFFPDVKFHDAGDAKKKYLIDFWVVPVAGQLQIEETRIYKAPLLADSEWTLMARQPVPWWWIPASEHPGHLATKRGWEVMSAVERNAMMEAARNNGVFKIKDDKTGKELDPGVRRHPSAGAPARQRWALFRVHRFSRRRHQGPDLRHRFLGQRQGRRDVGGPGESAQGTGAEGRSVDPGAALRMEGSRQLARRPLTAAPSGAHLM